MTARDDPGLEFRKAVRLYILIWELNVLVIEGAMKCRGDTT